MSPDRDDPILDAYLGEVLGGRTPPDLTARILQAWAATGNDPSRLDPRLLQALHGAPVPPPLAAEPTWVEPIAPPVQAPLYLNGHAPVAEPPLASAPLVALKPRRDSVKSVRAARRSQAPWLSLTIAGSVVLAGGLLVGYLALNGQFTEQPIAVSPTNKNNETKRETISPAPVAPKQNNNNPSRVNNDVVPKQPVFDSDNTPKFATTEPPTAWKDPPASSDHEIVAFVDTQMRGTWQANKVKPSPAASDAEWCRRAYLRLIGRIPSVEELSAFTGSKSTSKRTELVDRLLHDEQYAAEFERYWATQWSNTLIGRSGAIGNDELVSAEGLQQYLRDAIHTNKPYNKVVFELIAATGSNKPGTPDFNGATNFLLASQNEKETLATARTTRVFLGQQLQCAQCHNHPFNETTQHQFWALNSFFRQMKVQRDRATNAAKLVNTDFRGENGQADEADVFYELRNGQLKVAFPQFAGIELPKSGLVSEFDRRHELARLIAASDDMSRAVVNRTWAHFLGYGFTQPVDDMGQHNPPINAELLDRLAKEFKAHNYDTKSLLRWVALSEPFGLSSKIETFNVADAPQMGTAPLFSHYYTRQMQAEELYESLVASAQIAKRGGTADEQFKARVAWLGQ
ncbi:MAG TPA: DUF1549 domain-containing protein, partial [Pirellulaceae bacterium]|nr:DUF1549 domain-containing protein [Pirellulaceae bacterium]